MASMAFVHQEQIQVLHPTVVSGVDQLLLRASCEYGKGHIVIAFYHLGIDQNFLVRFTAVRNAFYNAALCSCMSSDCPYSLPASNTYRGGQV